MVEEYSAFAHGGMSRKVCEVLFVLSLRGNESCLLFQSPKNAKFSFFPLKRNGWSHREVVRRSGANMTACNVAMRKVFHSILIIAISVAFVLLILVLIFPW